MASKRDKKITAGIIAIVLVIMSISTLLVFLNLSAIQGGTESFHTADIDTIPLNIVNHFYNVTVLDENKEPLKNVHIVFFQYGTFKIDAFTDSEGKSSFYLQEGEYFIQFESFHYSVASQTIDLDKNTVVVQEMVSEEAMVFGTFPSWAIMSLLGLAMLLIIYVDRKKLMLGHWGRPNNWFNSIKNGGWTFIDESTKKILYSVIFVLLITLVIWIILYIPTYTYMAYYYIILGGISAICLFLEGWSKRYWIASIGFGKKKEFTGNALIGLMFAFFFIGITGFASQLELIPSSIGSFTILTILLIGIVAPFFEECFFSGVVAPTLAEKTGIIPSIAITSVVFMLGHTIAYGWSFLPLIGALLFRFVATVIVLYRKSWLGAFIAHAVINILSVIVIVMVF